MLYRFERQQNIHANKRKTQEIFGIREHVVERQL